MSENALADVAREDKGIESDEDFFSALEENKDDEQVEDAPAESPTENANEEENPSHQGDKEDEGEGTAPNSEGTQNTDDETIPFHKDPRWQEMRSELQKYKDEIENLKNIPDQLKDLQKKSDELPPEWVAVYGDDDVSRKAYKINQEMVSTATKAAIEAYKHDQAAEAERAAKIESDNKQWVQSEISKLQDSGEKFDKNKLMKVAVDYQPFDENGNISFSKALKIYRMIESAEAKQDNSVSIQKQVAAKTQSTNQGGSSAEPKPSVNSLRSRSFHSLLTND